MRYEAPRNYGGSSGGAPVRLAGAKASLGDLSYMVAERGWIYNGTDQREDAPCQ